MGLGSNFRVRLCWIHVLPLGICFLWSSGWNALWLSRGVSTHVGAWTFDGWSDLWLSRGILPELGAGVLSRGGL